MTQQDDSFPRVVFYYSLRKISFIVLVLVACVTLCGCVAGGYISGSESLDRKLALTALFFCSATLLLYGYRLWRINPFQPALIIDCYGLQESRYASQPIAWNYVEDIAMRKYAITVSNEHKQISYLEVLLRNDLPTPLYQQLTKSQWLNLRKGGLAVTIIPDVLSGADCDHLSSLLVKYYNRSRMHHNIDV